MAAFTLAASPCVDMSDADNQIHIHEAGKSVPCSCPSDIRPTLTISLPAYSIQKLKQWKKLLWYESFESLVSVTLSSAPSISDPIAFPPRIHRRAQG